MMQKMTCTALVLSLVGGVSWAGPNPPTVARDTTYYLGPLDEEGFVDYTAALNKAFGDPDAAAEDNVFVGLLPLMDTAEWDAEHRAALFAYCGQPEPDADAAPAWAWDFAAFYEQLPAGQKKTAPGPAAEEAQEEAAADAFGGLGEYGGGTSEHVPGYVIYEQIEGRPWTAEEFPSAAAWLEQLEPALDIASAAIHRPAYHAPVINPDPGDTMIAVLLPHLGDMRRLARAYRVRIHHHLGEGRADAATDDWLTLQRLGRMSSHEPFLISGLVGISINAMAHGSFDALLSHAPLSAEQVLRLRAGFADLPPRETLSRQIDEGERVFMLDTIQQLQRERVDDRTYKPMSAALAHPRFDVDRVLRRVNAFYDQYRDPPRTLEGLSARAAEIEAALEAMAPELMLAEIAIAAAADMPEEVDTDRLADGLADAMLGTLAPALGAALRTEFEVEMADNLAAVALALEAYRATHGDYPAQLAALVPALMEELPRDYATGEALRYRIEPGGFVLYSVGKNGEDDGGVDDHRDGDIVVRVDRRTEEERAEDAQ